MSEFDEQNAGVMPRHASDFQLEDEGMTQGTDPYSPQQYDQRNRDLMGYGSGGWSSTDKIWQGADGAWHAGASGDQGVNTGLDPAARLQQALDIYGSTEYFQPERDPNAGRSIVTGPQRGDDPNDTWRHRLYAERAASKAQRGGSVGPGGGLMGRYSGPTWDYPELNVGQFEYGATLDLPDYEPPEYDEGHERAIREEFIQSMKVDMSKQAQSAILGSASIDNPQARGQVIQAALEGFGSALRGAALEGSKEGRRAAESKYGRDVNVYNVNFDVRSAEEQARYDRELQEDLMNWEIELAKAEADYNTQMAGFQSMPAQQQYDAWKDAQKLDEYKR
jgi:hypothetical protein